MPCVLFDARVAMTLSAKYITRRCPHTLTILKYTNGSNCLKIKYIIIYILYDNIVTYKKQTHEKIFVVSIKFYKKKWNLNGLTRQNQYLKVSLV